jgi:hypothetical protein
MQLICLIMEELKTVEAGLPMICEELFPDMSEKRLSPGGSCLRRQ